MKMFKKSALALALTAATGMAHAAGEIDVQATFAGGAFASDVDVINTVTGEVGLSSLLAGAGAQVDYSTGSVEAGSLFNAAFARSIVYSPNTNISQNSTITFELTNGAVVAGANLPALWDGTQVVGNLIDFTQDANGNYTSLRFQVVNVDLDAANGYALADVTGLDPIISVNPGLTVGQSVSVAVTSAQDPSAIAIAQGTAPAETLVTVVDPINVTERFVTSVIDVEATPSRGLFVADQGATGGFDDSEAETSTTISRASFDIAEAAEVNPDWTQAGYTLTLNRDNVDGVQSVDLAIGAAALGAGANNLVQNGTDFVLTGANVAPIIGATGAPVTHNLDITATGTDVLQTGAWNLTLAVNNAADNSFSAFNILNNAASHTWDINGAQFKIPYHAQNASGFNFFFNAVNESTNDAGVFADVIVENKSQNTRVSLTNVELGTALANGSTTFGQAAIKAAINAAAAGTINDEDVYHVAMTLTAIAPQNAVQVAAFQKDAVGRTVVPVYVNTNNPADGRRWQQ